MSKLAIPTGYKLHDGGECPVGPNVLVDCIVRTGEKRKGCFLVGHSGVTPARYHLWEWHHHSKKDGKHIGAVLAYKERQYGEEIDLAARWSDKT